MCSLHAYYLGRKRGREGLSDGGREGEGEEESRGGRKSKKEGQMD